MWMGVATMFRIGRGHCGDVQGVSRTACRRQPEGVKPVSLEAGRGYSRIMTTTAERERIPNDVLTSVRKSMNLSQDEFAQGLRRAGEELEPNDASK
jgi:hypothetical protein